MWKEYYVAALLFLNGVWDWKKREVCLPSILVSLAAGLVGACWYQELSIRDLAGGLGIGVGMMVLAFLTKGAVGLGGFCALPACCLGWPEILSFC